jgi:hypothetical protein
MKVKFESSKQKLFYERDQTFEMFLVSRENDEIIRVANVVSRFEFVFAELIKRIHVDIDEHLRSQIAERQTFARTGRLETMNDTCEKFHCVEVNDMMRKNLKQSCVIYRSKEFSDVAFQHPASARVVFRDLIKKSLKALHGFVRALIVSARI